MHVRFKRMSNKDWAVSALREPYRPYAESQAGEPSWPYANANEALDDIDSWFKAHYPRWTQLHGNSRDDINVASTIEEEQKELGKVRDCFGSFPVLNKDVPK